MPANGLSFDLTSQERVTFGFKQGFGNRIEIGGNESSPSGIDRHVDSPPPSLSKTRSFSDAFAPEHLPPLPSFPAIPEAFFTRGSNSEPFPTFPQSLDQVFFQDSDQAQDGPVEEEVEEKEEEEELSVLKQYTNLLSPSPERKKQRLHHIASSPPRYTNTNSPFLTQSASTSNSYSFGPFPTGSHDFISTSTAPLAYGEDVSMPGADRIRSLSIGTGLDLLSLGGLGGGGGGGGEILPIQLPSPPSIQHAQEEPSSPLIEREQEEEEEEEAIPAVLNTISPQGATSDLSLHSSPTSPHPRPQSSVSSIEIPLAELIKEVEEEEGEEEDSSSLSEISSSPSPCPSLSPPPKHRRFSPTPPIHSSDQDEEEVEEVREEGTDQDEIVREAQGERALDLISKLSSLLNKPSSLPQGLLEVLEACLSDGGAAGEVSQLAVKLGLIDSQGSMNQEQDLVSSSHSSYSSFFPPRRLLRPRPSASASASTSSTPRFLPPKPTYRSSSHTTSSPPPVPLKSHPAYPKPFQLGWVYETGLDTFEEKRARRTISKLERRVEKVKREVESEDRGFESDDEGDEGRGSMSKRGRGAKRGKGSKRGRGRGRGRGRKVRDCEVDEE